MDMDEAVAADIWYRQSEMNQIKRKAMSIARDAQRYGLGSILSNTYGKDCGETQHSINTWARNGASRRGLERMINNEYAAKRADIRKRTIKSVLRAQMKMEEEGVNDKDYQLTVLARLSEAFSQDSRNFARVLGRADEHAANVDNTAESPAFMVKTNDKKIELPSRSISPHSQISRTPSPRSVLLATQLRPKRNIGLSGGGSTSAMSDMRHYY